MNNPLHSLPLVPLLHCYFHNILLNIETFVPAFYVNMFDPNSLGIYSPQFVHVSALLQPLCCQRFYYYYYYSIDKRHYSFIWRKLFSKLTKNDSFAQLIVIFDWFHPRKAMWLWGKWNKQMIDLFCIHITVDDNITLFPGKFFSTHNLRKLSRHFSAFISIVLSLISSIGNWENEMKFFFFGK